MNDVVRAGRRETTRHRPRSQAPVLGYGSGTHQATAGLPHVVTEAASDSVGAAHEIGAQLGSGARAELIDTAGSAFRPLRDDDLHPRGRGCGDRRWHRSSDPRPRANGKPWLCSHPSRSSRPCSRSHPHRPTTSA